MFKGGGINPEKVCLGLLSSSTNQGCIAKDVSPFILSIIILWFCTKVRSYKLSQISTPLDITQYPLVCLGVRWILAGSSYCMVSHLCDDTEGIWLPQGITSSIHGLQTQLYEIVIYHRIWVPRSNILCYFILCSIICPDWDLEIISNPVNGIEHIIPELKNISKKEYFWLWSKYVLKVKYERCLEWIRITYRSYSRLHWRYQPTSQT